MLRNLFLVIHLLLGGYGNAQKKMLPNSTLSTQPYDYLNSKIEQYRDDSLIVAPYIRAYLIKAKREQNWEKVINGYKNQLHEAAENEKLFYADSMIMVAEKTGDNGLIGSAYLSKGIVYYGRKEHIRALDNYIIAYDHIIKTDDQYLKHKAYYNIGHIKYYLGFYDEALIVFQKCIDYFRNEDSRAYLNSIHSLGLCHNRMGNYSLCTATNNLGLKEGARLDNNEMLPYFLHSEGINQYFRKNYTHSIQKIENSLPWIIENKDFANESVAFFYIGKSYWSAHKKEKALFYFKKMDTIFEIRNYIRPDLREGYELLIGHYKSKKDLKMQLYYVNKLIKADSILNTNFKYLSGKVHKEYDTKKLLSEKEKIEKQLLNKENHDFAFITTIISLFILVLYLSFSFMIKKRRFKSKFKELMNDVKVPPKDGKKTDTGIHVINPEVALELLKSIERFEAEKKYLEKDMTLNRLSALYNSNTRYMSIIIHHYRNKKYTDYLNDLKIEHIVLLLKENTKYRNYTFKALADEAGFSNAQHLTKAFFAKTGITLSFFIAELKKENSLNDKKQIDHPNN